MSKILVLGKKRDDFYFQKAIDFTLQFFPDTVLVLAKPGDPFPLETLQWSGDYIISYLCPWVLPAALIERANIAAINFHPATPEYPGTGCTNFAIYNNEPVYGVMSHYIDPKVDTGRIISVRRFPVFSRDTVYSLTQRCYAHMLVLYYDILSLIIEGKPLPLSEETWKKAPYRKKDLDALKRLTLDMTEAEIARRIRASTYPGTSGAYIEINGQRFEYVPGEENCKP